MTLMNRIENCLDSTDSLTVLRGSSSVVILVAQKRLQDFERLIKQLPKTKNPSLFVGKLNDILALG